MSATTYCDSCGAPCGSGDTSRNYELHLPWRRGLGRGVPMKGDLCEECIETLVSFLKGEVRLLASAAEDSTR